jgi:UDP-N-acetylglucosamine--N-acetylmuramyl-(pentapeptide) pyrophosphoryl-undecaprenol N-acetylglucosamine transferase
MLKILITGGGTGGHIFPALAVADALKRQKPDAEFLFVGAEGKMEMERVPKAGYAIEGLKVAGFHRGFSLNNIWRNLSFPYKLAVSMWQARKIIERFNPNIVIGTGGYASGPIMRAAQARGIPTIVQEQNSHAGVTNQFLGNKASKICVAYEGMENYFPEDRIVFTGNPVRKDILELKGKKSEAYQYFKLDENKKTIILIGGSLGARTLNHAMRDNAAFFEANPQYQILWQCGKFYYEEMQNTATSKLPNVHLVQFIDRMDLAYSIANVIISRAGALSISELCLVGKPVILVPSPNVAEDHQTKNAMSLVNKGAARLVTDAEAVENMLADAKLILQNDALAFGLSESIRSLGKPDAAENIAKEALTLIDSKTL